MTILPAEILQSWERTIRAVELVKNRVLRATTALEVCGQLLTQSSEAMRLRGGRVDQAAVRSPTMGKLPDRQYRCPA